MITTRVGSIGSRHPVTVDDRGRVDVGAGWVLDWWVGADDRWHVPQVEAAVRQYLVDQAPVVETLARIPGGDARQCVYGYRGTAFDGGDEYIVVEVTNQSAIPFGLALVLRPDPNHPGAEQGEVTVEPVAGASGRDEAHVLKRDGRPILLLPRRPAHVVTGAGDPWAVLVFPVAHTTSLRSVLPLGAEAEGTAGLAYPGAIPTAVQVANGWAAQADRAARYDVPDPQMADALAVAQRQVLLYPPSLALAPALDLLGFHDEAAQALADELAIADRSLDQADRSGDFLVALAQHCRLAGDPDLLARSVVAVAASAQAVAAPYLPRRSRWFAKAAPSASPPVDTAPGTPSPARALAAIEAAAELLDAAGEAKGANDARRLADEVRPRVASTPTDDSEPVAAVDAVVGLVRSLRALLVADVGADDDTGGGLALIPELPPTWYGQAIDVRDAPTSAGPLSFSVRWHGERPALLWELTSRTGRPVTITAPGLDPTWSSAESRGETLLERVAPPPPDERVLGSDRTGPLTSAEPPVSVWSIGPSGQLTIDPDASLPDPGPSFS